MTRVQLLVPGIHQIARRDERLVAQQAMRRHRQRSPQIRAVYHAGSRSIGRFGQLQRNAQIPVGNLE
jgi:hypothetical protein